MPRLEKMINCLKVLLFLLPTTSFATCVVNFNNTSANVNWDRNFNYQIISFSITKVNPEACSIRLGFTKGQAPDYNRYASVNGKNVAYQLYQNSTFSTPLKDGSDVSSINETINLSFGSGTNVTQLVNYYVQIPLGSMISPNYKEYGTYLDTFNIKAYDSSDATLSSPLTVGSVSLSIAVSAIFEVSLVDTGAAFDPTSVIKSVNLGDLSIPQTANVDLKVRSNLGYKISVSSQNGGKLKQNGMSQYSIRQLRFQGQQSLMVQQITLT
jgi:spore coat protein U-like protein